MKLTHEELAALPERVRNALTSGPVTIEEPVKEWEPQLEKYLACLAGVVAKIDQVDSGHRPDLRKQGITRATEKQAMHLLKDRQGYCLQHAYRDQYAPDYVEPPMGELVYYVVINQNGQPRVGGTSWCPLNTITMPHWLCEQLVADIKSGRYKL